MATADPLVVRRGGLECQVLLTGELVAEEALALTTPNVNIWPMVVRWMAEDGSEVHAGDRLVEFDNTQLTVNLEELRTRVVEQRSRLDSSSAQLAGEMSEAVFAVEQQRAVRDKARLDAALPEGLHAQMELARRRLAVRKAELELAEAERGLVATRATGQADLDILGVALREAQVELDRAEAGIDRLVLRAPRTGILIVAENPQEDRPFQNGDTTWPGSTVASLPDLTTIVVRAQLFDVDDGRVTPGEPVEAVLDAFPDQRFHGRVREVDGVAQELRGGSPRRAFRTIVDLDTVDTERMRPGMSVKLVVSQPPLDGVLLAPRVAIDFDREPPRARRADGSWATVTLGACDAWVCVVEQGLSEGETLGGVAR